MKPEGIGFLHSGISTRKTWDEDRIFPGVDDWMRKKKKEDGAEGLWRIHDNLYDLSGWTKKHPGGSYWLQVTRGTDITEAFECNHLTDKAEQLLTKFYVRRAKTKRNCFVTFKEDGFFKTLKRKIVERKLLDDSSTKPQKKTKILADVLVLSVFASGLMGAHCSYWCLLVSGFLLAILTTCSHNFFHMRDNWRMYYFNLSLMSFREWRISHVLSHHLFPNSNLDLEVSMVEPTMNFLPRADKKIRYTSWILAPFVMACLAHVQFFRRMLKIFKMPLSAEFQWKEEIVAFALPLFIYTASGRGLWCTLLVWNLITVSGSLVFAFIGFTAAHHHPDIYHDGDFLGNDRDFGVLQLAAVRDRSDVDGNFVLTTTMFGNHAMHHLFPTIDHSKLHDLNPVLEETCREFNLTFKPMKAKNLVRGMFLQLIRNHTNSKLNILKN